MNEEERFSLPVSAKEVVIKGYVSGKIDAEIQSIVQSGYNLETDIDMSGDLSDAKPGKSKMKFDVSSTLKANQRAMELMLISLDGDSSNVYDRVMDLPKGDTDFITEKINDITDKSKIAPKLKKN